MKREDFRIVPKLYETNNLTYILHNDVVIGYVEIFDNLFFELVDKEKMKWESQKKKRKPADITNECERIIKRYIETHSTELV